jgi:hypothetical protein
MYNSPPTSVLKVFKERGEREVVGKKRSILASLDFESKIAMHFPFFKVSRLHSKLAPPYFLSKF